MSKIPISKNCCTWDRSLLNKKTYLGGLLGRGSVLAALFVLTFYILGSVSFRRYISLREGANLLEVFWLVFGVIFAIIIYREFPEFYGYMLRRMRLYGFVGWLFRLWLSLIAFSAALGLALFLDTKLIERSLESYKIQPLIALFGISLFLIIFLYAFVCTVIAEARGTRFRDR
jgi:hypothetical protein